METNRDKPRISLERYSLERIKMIENGRNKPLYFFYAFKYMLLLRINVLIIHLI